MLDGLDLDELRRSGAIFLDDGGVLNDNRLRAPEWRRLIGEYMPPRLGGSAEDWQHHNSVVIGRVLDGLFARLPTFDSHRAFQRSYAHEWMTQMCEAVGVDMPQDPESAYRDLSCYVAERANAAMPGAADAVRQLHRAGLRLSMASGTTSWELQGILGHMGVADCFDTLYGPDIVDVVKYGANYYEKVFAHAGVEPSVALVIDSDLVFCDWAREAGAHALWVDPDGRGDAPSLAVLVDALDAQAG